MKRRTVVAIASLALVALAGTAAAGKPTAAQAKKAVVAWLAAMAVDQDSEAATPSTAALTATPFYSVALDENSENATKCPETTATDAAATTKALICLSHNVVNEGKLKAWTAKTWKVSGIPYSHSKELHALAKTSTLVFLESPCAGTFNQVAFAVTKDAAKDATPKIAAVLALTGMCGE